MGFLFFVIAFIAFIGIITSSEENSYTGKKKCKLHKWEYNSSGRLQCEVCREFPGYSGRE